MIEKINGLVSLLLSSIVVTSFTLSGDIKSHSIFNIIFLALVHYMIYKTKFKFNNKFELILNIFLTSIFSIILVCGKCLYSYAYNESVDILKIIFTFKNLFILFGYFILIFTVLYNLISYLYKLKLTTKELYKTDYRKIFICVFFIIILCWVPFFMALYPGVLTLDSLSELDSVVYKGINSDHHPVFHQLFILFFYNIGKIFLNTTTDIVAFINFVQMVILALIFSYTICFLYKRKVKLLIIGFITVYFALYPGFLYLSCTMWKDVLFGGFVLIFILILIDIIENKNNIKISNIVCMVISSLLMLLFRNNAIYMYILLIPFLILFFRKQLKTIVLIIAIVLSAFFIIKGPIYKSLGINKSSSSEYLAIPLQQIGRMAYKNVLHEDEKILIEKLIPIDILKEVYDPRTVDKIKFNSNYQPAFLLENKVEFIKLYIRLLMKHPSVAIESYLISTLGYWYPDLEATGLSMFYSEDGNISKISDPSSNIIANEIHDAPKGSSFVSYISTKLISRNIPLISMQWSIGLVYWIILLFLFVCWLKNGFCSLLPYLPVLGIWLTLMIAAPVWAEYRYIFSAYTCLPILICYPYIYNIKNE